MLRKLNKRIYTAEATVKGGRQGHARTSDGMLDLDVAKALAFGPRAVLVGRVWLFGLAAGGEAGVRQVLEILRNGTDEALIGLRHSSVRELSRQDLVIPDGFAISTEQAENSVISARGVGGAL